MTQIHLAYLCSQYPAVSHTFINREIQQLENHGVKVSPFSMRPGSILDGATDFEVAQMADTWVIHKQSLLTILWAMPWAFFKGPIRFIAAFFYALQLQQFRPRECLWALFHLLEGCMLAREMKRRGINHVHVHFANSEAAIALYAHKACGIQYSFTLHGPDCFYNMVLGNFEAKVAHAAFIVTISHFATGQVVRVAGVESMKRMDIVRCGVDPERYTPLARTASTDDVFNIVCTGRLTPTKGQALLVDACKTLSDEGRDFRCVFIGGGDDFEPLKQRVQDYGIGDKVSLTGPLPQDGVRDHLQKAHLFALPSFAEGVPVVLMEAMSMEIPCISTRVGGIAELIEDGVNGYLVHSGDADGLASRLRDAMDHRQQLPKLGEAARQRILEQFDVRKSGARLAEIFKRRLG